MTELQSRPHRRFNPLLREWVLVSPQRTQRPWQGQVEPAPPQQGTAPPQYDPHCYLCPGNQRARGARNPAYAAAFVFDNDYPALESASNGGSGTAADPDCPAARLLVSGPESGACRVVCFSPRHDLTLPRLGQVEIEGVISVWTAQYRELGARPDVQSVMIFENRGAMMGASNPHPHGQIWANSHLPNQIAREQAALLDYRRDHRSCLLCSYLQLELQRRERIICENDGFVALVPYWANWPFEALLLSRAHRGGLEQLAASELSQLADLVKRLTTRYDNLFQTSFPNSWGFHLPPTDGAPHPECHLHAHFFPPLLRSATVRKFMVGYELLAMPQRDLTPENAAERLRAASEAHFLDSQPTQD